jgi:zinc protease
VPRTHPDYFPLTVMNAILGGLFSSRINLNLRERHGYTYGARSAFDWRRGAGPFCVETAVRTEVTAEAVREIIVEIERMRSDAVTPDELSLAIDYLDGVFPLRCETTVAVARELALAEVHALGADYFDLYRERVRGVTAADVQRVASAHIQPENLLVLAVGDAAAIRGPLEDLRLAAVDVRDPQAEEERP